MSNLIEAAEELEYLPKQNLIEMMQSGNSRYPQYLVLSEIQRRTQLEKLYAGMQPKPSTTVAEETVQEFSQKGLAGAQPTLVFSQAPASSMASGGLTGYQDRGRTTYDQTFITGISPAFINNPFAGPITQAGNVAYQDLMQRIESLKALPVTGKDIRERDSRVASLENQAENLLSSFSSSPIPTTTRGIAAREREGREASMKALENLAANEFLPVAAEEAGSQEAGSNNLFDPNAIKEGTRETDTSILSSMNEVIAGLNLPKSEFKAPTKEEREREINAIALSQLGASVGSATNIGDIAKGLGQATEDVIDAKRFQRAEDIEVQGLVRAEAAKDMDLALKILGLEAAKQQAILDKDEQTLDRIELLMDALDKSIADPERAKNIEAEIDKLLNLKKIDLSNIVPKRSG